MIERFLHHLAVERPPAEETAAEARVRLAEKFSRAALRRMTHLGLLLGSALEGVALRPDDAVVYATTFAETRALEDYLASFPTPSPLLFQTSIHPSAVQQVLIGRQQPVGRLWPLAGRARLVEQACQLALLETASRVILVGGEERGTWMLEQGMASGHAFAFAAVLGREKENARGSVRFVPAASDASAADDACPTLAVLADTLAERKALRWRSAVGNWSVELT